MLQTAGEVSAVALAAGIIVSALQWISESPDRVVAFADVLAVCVLPLVGSVSALGNIYVWKRLRLLQRELHLAQEELNYLQEKLERPNTTDLLQGEDKEIRIFMDGAFDLLHFGHMNAFRLARSLGTHLIVGVNSDASITECKGEPLMNDNERLTMVSSCKFVDEVIPECPYIMSEEYLSWAIKTYRIDYVVHGDDPCIVDGKDVYASAKEMGKFRTIPRTCGVSTTDIVGRMLLLTKDHHYHNTIPTKKNSKESLEMELSSLSSTLSRNASSRASCLGKQSKFLTTNRMLQLFGAGVKAPTKCMRVIYIDGAWDLFHPGHVAILKVAREVSFLLNLLSVFVIVLQSHHFPLDREATISLSEFLVTMW